MRRLRVLAVVIAAILWTDAATRFAAQTQSRFKSSRPGDWRNLLTFFWGVSEETR